MNSPPQPMGFVFKQRLLRLRSLWASFSNSDYFVFKQRLLRFQAAIASFPSSDCSSIRLQPFSNSDISFSCLKPFLSDIA